MCLAFTKSTILESKTNIRLVREAALPMPGNVARLQGANLLNPMLHIPCKVKSKIILITLA